MKFLITIWLDITKPDIVKKKTLDKIGNMIEFYKK